MGSFGYFSLMTICCCIPLLDNITPDYSPADDYLGGKYAEFGKAFPDKDKMRALSRGGTLNTVVNPTGDSGSGAPATSNAGHQVHAPSTSGASTHRGTRATGTAGSTRSTQSTAVPRPGGRTHAATVDPYSRYGEWCRRW